MVMPSLSLANSPVTVDAPPSSIIQILTAEQAVHKVRALPEVQAWQQYITEKADEAKENAAIRPVFRVEPEPVKIDQQSYWLVHFLESHAIHDHRWQSFWVNLYGGEILADDSAGRLLGLDSWRKQTQPMRRIRQSAKLKDGTYIGRGLGDYLEVEGDRCRFNQGGAVYPWQEPCHLIQIDGDRIYDGNRYWHR